MVGLNMAHSESGSRKRSMSLAGEKRVGSDGSVTVGQLQRPQKVLYQGDEKASEREGVKVVWEEKEAGENWRNAEGQPMVEETGGLSNEFR